LRTARASSGGLMLARFGRWLAIPANLTFAIALGGIVFTAAFWAITNRIEPTLVATFGMLLTASGLLAGRDAGAPPKPPPEDREE
jgi:hypothetical protein